MFWSMLTSTTWPSIILVHFGMRVVKSMYISWPSALVVLTISHTSPHSLLTAALEMQVNGEEDDHKEVKVEDVPALKGKLLLRPSNRLADGAEKFRP